MLAPAQPLRTYAAPRCHNRTRSPTTPGFHLQKCISRVATLIVVASVRPENDYFAVCHPGGMKIYMTVERRKCRQQCVFLTTWSPFRHKSLMKMNWLVFFVCLFLCHSLGQLSRKTSDEERVNIAAS